jgi:L-seryl-tRNA(Ser) seleniumtransferase
VADPVPGLRELPSVHQVLERLSPQARRFPHALIVREIRLALQAARHSGSFGKPVEATVEAALFRWAQRSLRGVINATGVVLHTNLGRAPLGDMVPLAGYSNLEFDLATGKRGKRDSHLSGLLEVLLGATAIAVNNGAAAMYLALNELADGREVIISRGELIEIGDGFRIPDIMRRAGAVLREVGTTNRTRIEDYREALSEHTRMILRVHPSNFQMTGFTGKPELRELADLARQAELPLYEDLGSGCLVDLRPFGIDEPLVQDSLRAGVNLVSFSGDKLLGGPQTGLLAGDAALVERLRRNPMFRALRVDKLITEALERTLRALVLEDWDKLPALRMLRLTAEEIRVRADEMRDQLPGSRVEAGESVTGGGATPQKTLPTFVLVVAANSAGKAERMLRANDPPVIARIQQDRLLIDLRTVAVSEEPALLAALQKI